ncbi:sulfite exporter TauE/SafE family protein [Candidatus Aeolococcus gillhamiae]|uniref:sulfite exporter TauE/SafE family protein n=1 Tax=Candidatus Aeolococcus gillhamiae TaxID=3127015 RepID=UPI0030788717
MIHLDTARLLLVAGAAFLAAAANAIGGGGTLISFPALLLLGFPALTANVTNTVGLLPGYAGGSLAYRAELSVQRRRVLFLGPISVVGAVGGAILLTRTSNAVFAAVVPWLILLACALLLLQPVVTSRVRTRRPEREQHRSPALIVVQFLGGVYGAFFGAGLGVMMLAVLGLFIRDDLQRINALKGMMALIINVVAAIYFAFFGPVSWLAAAIMLPAGAVGGFAGVSLARRMRPAILRTVVVVFGVAFALHQLLT